MVEYICIALFLMLCSLGEQSFEAQSFLNTTEFKDHSIFDFIQQKHFTELLITVMVLV